MGTWLDSGGVKNSSIVRHTARDERDGHVQIAGVEVEVNTKVMATTKVVMVQTMHWGHPIVLGDPRTRGSLVLLNSRVRLRMLEAIRYTRVSRTHTLQRG